LRGWLLCALPVALFGERSGFRCTNFQKQRDNVLIGIRNI
jgi:hypothetical protein